MTTDVDREVRALRPDREVATQQRLPYFVGVSAATAGATGLSMHLVVIPPGDSDQLFMPLDGLPTLLESLRRSDVDITVIAGPALLEDANATIIAWATRSVLWAVEMGTSTEQDLSEAASRLQLAGVTPFGVAVIGPEAE